MDKTGLLKQPDALANCRPVYSELPNQVGFSADRLTRTNAPSEYLPLDCLGDQLVRRHRINSIEFLNGFWRHGRDPRCVHGAHI